VAYTITKPTLVTLGGDIASKAAAHPPLLACLLLAFVCTRYTGVYVAKTRKRTVAFRCYAACSLARLLLGKKSRLQCRLRAAVKAVLAQGSCTLLDLQVAWHLAGVKKVEEEEEMAWEEVWMEKGQWRRFK
jgi:hypothetical protein